MMILRSGTVVLRAAVPELSAEIKQKQRSLYIRFIRIGISLCGFIGLQEG